MSTISIYILEGFQLVKKDNIHLHLHCLSAYRCYCPAVVDIALLSAASLATSSDTR
jgi:fluoride ion exporter CrcB/FEX